MNKQYRTYLLGNGDLAIDTEAGHSDPIATFNRHHNVKAQAYVAFLNEGCPPKPERFYVVDRGEGLAQVWERIPGTFPVSTDLNVARADAFARLLNEAKELPE